MVLPECTALTQGRVHSSCKAVDTCGLVFVPLSCSLLHSEPATCLSSGRAPCMQNRCSRPALLAGCAAQRSAALYYYLDLSAWLG